MKINRDFPPCPNCLSHLLVLECSYESYQPLWPHLSFQFFFIQWQPLSSPHPCYPLDFASLWHLGFLGPGLVLPSWLWVCGHPQAGLLSLNSSSLFSLMVSSKFLWSASWRWLPFSWKIPLLPRPVVTELRALNLWLSPARAFQPNWCCPKSCLRIACRVLS